MTFSERTYRTASFALLPAVLALTASLACSPSDDGDDATGSGGSFSSGGSTPTSGGSTSAGGTLASGGQTSGGSTSGGASAGGTNAGGSATGGASSGGSENSTGGAAAGGAATGGSTGTGGEGSGGTSGLVGEIMRADDSYVFEFDDILFEVDPTQGARIVTFSKGGTNLLDGLSSQDGFLNGGSTLWLSPQDSWEGGWPPPPAIDSDPHSVMLADLTIVTESPSATLPAGQEFSVSKRFSANLETEAIEITYGVENEGTSPQSCGLWEVSRHARGGLTFWPGVEVETGEFTLGAPQEGVIWWDDSSSSDMGKVFSDGSEGWIAHVAGDLMLVKVWADGSALAPGHGEVELYLGDGYIEIEEHGPFFEVAAGESKTWDIRWHVVTLEDTIDASPGSAELLAIARSLAK